MGAAVMEPEPAGLNELQHQEELIGQLQAVLEQNSRLRDDWQRQAEPVGRWASPAEQHGASQQACP